MSEENKCKFYDKEKHKCSALKDLYCEKEDKPCAFRKEETSEVKG